MPSRIIAEYFFETPHPVEAAAESIMGRDPGRRLQGAFLLAALVGFLTALLGLVPAVQPRRPAMNDQSSWTKVVKRPR